jgi:hypothetical protein
MAHIVQLRSGFARTEPGGEEGEREAQVGAKIIIFPGVRREYHAEMPATPQRRAAGQPDRDRLELPD